MADWASLRSLLRACSAVIQKEDEEGKVGVKIGKELMKVAGVALKANITRLGPLVLPVSEQLIFAGNFVARKARMHPLRMPYHVVDIPLPCHPGAAVLQMDLDLGAPHVDDSDAHDRADNPNHLGLPAQVLKMSLKPYVPDFTTAFEHFCIHPGGKAVIEEVSKQLKLRPEQALPMLVPFERYGNTSSSSTW